MLNFNMTFNLSINSQALFRAGQFALDQQVVKDSNYYIPMDTTATEASGISATTFGEGQVRWNTPYARKIYYGTNINFHKDKNPNAQALWFEAAKASKKTLWVEMARRAMLDNLNG